MIRALLIFVNFFAIWIAGLVSGEPTADLNAPRTVKAGADFVVEAVIHKGDAKDFLRFAQTLPAGFTASPMETDGGTFYFEQQTVKILWSKLPEKADLKISYKVMVDASMAGEYQIAGKISYVVDNLPKPVALPSLWVTVGSGGETAVVSNPVNTENTTSNPSTSTTTTTTAAVDSTVRPDASVTAMRTVPTEMVKNEFQVDIAVEKGDLRNFAKIQDSLPDGFSAKLIKSDGAEFEFKNNVVTFRWYAVPNKTTLNISYKVIVSPDMSGPQTIRGHFSYIENDKGKNVFIAPSTVNIEANPALAQENATSNSGNTTTTNTERSTENSGNTNTTNSGTTETNTNNTNNTNTTNSGTTETTSNTTSNNNTTNASGNLNNTENTSNTGNATTTNTATENTSTTNAATNTAGNSNTNNSNTANTTTENTAANNSNTTNSETERAAGAGLNASNTASALGIRFSVQIAAMTRMVPIAFFANAFSISAPINAEQIDGLNKYTTGAFGNYSEARNHRETLRNKGVAGAFVMAYNNNKRVTVQEALMISGQTWLR
ncbi:MAG: hypothetical protein ACRCYO_11765 [Bacteroidia bacterium]